VLGFFKLKRSWEWAAYGKHPVARDYFSTCDHIPILKAFSAWVEKGFQSLKPGQSKESWNSFRFWIKGPQKDLILGTLHDSSDSIGRKFPLLIIGTGPLKDWEKNWEMLTHICEKTWTRAEYLACKRYSDIKMLESDIRAMPTLQADGSDHTDKNHQADPPQGITKSPDLKPQLRELVQNGKALFQIAPLPSSDLQESADHLHLLLKKELGPYTPNAIFTTVLSGEENMIVFKRPLVTEDFSFLVEAAKLPGYGR